MEGMERRRFLTKTFQGLGAALLASVPGSFFNARKALAQVKQVAPKPLVVSPSATLKSVLPKTTTQNVIQVLQTSKLSPEDSFAVLAVRQLSADEIRQSLTALGKISGVGVVGDIDTGADCGISCGKSCGADCGSNCGTNCGVMCLAPANACTGAFCGGGCSAQPGAIGLVDVAGKLGINFQNISVQKIQQSVNEALGLLK